MFSWTMMIMILLRRHQNVLLQQERPQLALNPREQQQRPLPARIDRVNSISHHSRRLHNKSLWRLAMMLSQMIHLSLCLLRDHAGAEVCWWAFAVTCDACLVTK